jgi:hypothetical protein
MFSRQPLPTPHRDVPLCLGRPAPRAGVLLGILWIGLRLLAGTAGAAANDRAADKPAKPAAASPIAGVAVDWQRGVIEASASAAADLYAASADVARLKAERLARARAEERLRRALAGLRSDPRLLSRVPAGPAALDVSRATVSFIDYGSNGSVVLRLSLPLSVLPAVTDKKAGQSDGGASSPSPDLGVNASESREN